MDKLTGKIMYLLRGLYEIPETEEKNIVSILDKLTEEEKIDIAYMLYQRLEIENNMFKEAILKLKTIDHDIEEYHTKQEADKWLEDIL
jgi:hypothetical protein